MGLACLSRQKRTEIARNGGLAEAKNGEKKERRQEEQKHKPTP